MALVMNDNLFHIRDKELRELYDTLIDGRTPLDWKRKKLRKFEEYMERQQRNAKLSFLKEILWLICDGDLPMLGKALKKRREPVAKGEMADVECLVKAASFALMELSEKEAAGIMAALQAVSDRDFGNQEMPFM